MSKKQESRVLVIGDTHCPFDHDDYVDFLKGVYKKYKCNRVVHIGDEIDNHFASYHETDPDGLSGGDELDAAIERLAAYVKAFPVVDVIIGNHSRMVMRKAFSGGIPKRWIRDYSEVLGAPNWTWQDRLVIDGVQYIHGEAGTARKKAKDDMMSTVQGHLHTQAYIEWLVGANYKVFGMQVGCGVDHESYALAYAKRGKKPAIGCGVVIDGKPHLEMMDL